MVTVRFFALLKEMAGKEELEFPLKGETPLKDFMDRLKETLPEIVAMVGKRRILVSVNQEFATLDTVIKDGDEIALLPPFSGGTSGGLTGPAVASNQGGEECPLAGRHIKWHMDTVATESGGAASTVSGADTVPRNRTGRGQTRNKTR